MPLLRPAALLTALLVLCATPGRAQLFESDSKRFGQGKMDILLKEVERRPRASVLRIDIRNVGSSVGSSFFLLCSIRTLALARGGYRHIAKREEHPRPGHMLVGFLHSADEPPADADPAFAAGSVQVVALDQFAPICDAMK